MKKVIILLMLCTLGAAIYTGQKFVTDQTNAYQRFVFSGAYRTDNLEQRDPLLQTHNADGCYIWNEDAPETILLFGATWANPAHLAEAIATQATPNKRVVTCIYPGYRRTPMDRGLPEQASQKSFLEAALQHAETYKPDYLIGYSIGSTVANWLSSQVETKGVILIAPNVNMARTYQKARNISPWIATFAAEKQNFDSLKWSNLGNTPTHMIWGEKDEIVSNEDRNELFTALNKAGRLKTTRYIVGEHHDIGTFRGRENGDGTHYVGVHPKLLMLLRDLFSQEEPDTKKGSLAGAFFFVR